MADYLVLIACSSDETGTRFEPGDVVTERDFPADVIDNWLEITPPVLALATVVEGDDDGGNG